tara:strand:+ start:1006 stop:1254 length:249 start_codon:yes stop_codon:yes gene_type:complete
VKTVAITSYSLFGDLHVIQGAGVQISMAPFNFTIGKRSFQSLQFLRKILLQQKGMISKKLITMVKIFYQGPSLFSTISIFKN